MPASYTTENTDLRELLQLTPSAAYELLLSLRALYRAPARHEEWAVRARATLGPERLADVHFFYGELWHEMCLLELPVDYPGAADDAAGFIDYVAGLDPDTFLFYLWGRVIPREDIPRLRANPDQVVVAIRAFYDEVWPGKGPDYTQGAALAASAREPQAFQRRLVTLLREYYDRVFRAELAVLRRRWAASIAEKREALSRTDPNVVLSRVLGGFSLPAMYPPGTPLQEVRLIPSYYLWSQSFQIWGYGIDVVLYDANLTEARVQALDEEATQLTQFAGALADPNRLKILRAISQDQEVYGHKLARLCGISQPAISRHMGILKRAGLVDEVHSEGRVLYQLRRATVEAFMPQLLHYLSD